MATLEKIFALEGLNTPQERAEYVAAQMGTDEKKRLFFYKEYHNEDSGEKPIVCMALNFSPRIADHPSLTGHFPVAPRCCNICKSSQQYIRCPIGTYL
jgi:hypothetical protein